MRVERDTSRRVLALCGDIVARLRFVCPQRDGHGSWDQKERTSGRGDVKPVVDQRRALASCCVGCGG